ncbi:fused MFS/spermidine synthase [Streptomyces xiamenensis]|uniref:spermidine synthase n=1 Tax=Streptomyces xiamenensis TaxID=408015 RepID=UPI00342EBFDD
MARRGRQAAETTTAQVAGGRAELLPDADRAEAWELLLDGAPQSHVDLAEPTRLGFEYQRRLGHVIDVLAPPRAPLRVVHLGGGALTLARYVAVTRPRSGQQVAEPDAALTEFVRRHLPLPAGARVKVRALDAREALDRLPEHSADLVIADIFAHARTPAHCASAEFLDAVRRVLAPGGTYAANITDGGPLTHLRGQSATALSRFGTAALSIAPAVLRGRRYGNGILLAADGPLPLDALRQRLAREPQPTRLLTDTALTDFTAGAAVVTDATAQPSPAPPEGLFD